MSRLINKNDRKEAKEANLKLLYVLLQPTRQKIIKILKNSKEPLNIKQIAEKVSESEINTSFHISTLAEHGLVEGEYIESESPTHHSVITGRAVKFYKLSSRVNGVINNLSKEMQYNK